jgi:predicted metal-dependent HD superfamily phosphohydrolase
MSYPLLTQVQQYVSNLFATKVKSAFTFHNLSHTQGVVEAATEMADYYALHEEDRMALLLAAWFHDTGYSKGDGDDHETVSQQIATAWLQDKNVSASLLQKMNGCIAATRMPQSPTTLIEQILCDADMYHLGTDRFAEENKLLRRELNEVYGKNISKKEWRLINIEFLKRQRYFTDYCRRKLEPGKQQNLQALLEKEGLSNKKEAVPVKTPLQKELVASMDNANQELNNEKRKEKEGRTERGIATMFRIMSDNHMNLSQMADSKANIMISVNTIVVSILVSVLFSKLQYYPQFIIPTVILIVVCVTAIVFAILATRPNVNKGFFSKEDIEQKKVNLLFFGNFFNMGLPEYDWAMKEMMKDKEYLYGSMIKDIYFLGKVLARKYKLLRIAYNVFMFGLIVAILAFVIAFLVAKPE